MARTTAIVIVSLVLASPAAAEFTMPSDAPVERLIRNITAYTKENPKDPDGYYTLGRVHLLAFTLKSGSVKTFDPGDDAGKKLPQLPDDSFQRGPARPPRGPVESQPTPPTEEQLVEHIKAAIENYRKAIEMSPKNALYRLGLACALKQGADVGDKIGLVPGQKVIGKDFSPAEARKRDEKFEELVKKLGDANFANRDAAFKELRGLTAEAMQILLKHTKDADAEIKARVSKLIGDYWREAAIPEYLEAYKLAIAKDLEIKRQPLQGLKSLVGYEAGQSYLRLVKARGETPAEKDQIAKVEEDIKKLESKPPGGITPIVFSLDEPARLDQLLAPEVRVPFDLDGTGRAQMWTWVRPATGILVWDPNRTGRITSGRQLFGSVTFFMFWPDGYRALNALDDNRDGQLEGGELRGLAVWFDRDSNGRSDPGEVVPIEKAGIKLISVRAASRIGESPFNSTGLETLDGRVLPTYDWVAQPAKAKP
ncbi:MAG: hypothetical protein ACE15C_03405 [Phycisphaerae bacterium]